MNSTLENRIDICDRLRSKTADIFAEILLENKILSEVSFRENIISKLSEDKNIYKEGWYNPPPFGVGVLFGSSSDSSRLSFKTLRKEEFWPREDCFFRKESIGLLYASPVDVKTATIGDFGVMAYNGTNLKIQEHLIKCLEVLEKIAEFAEVGMEFGEVCRQSQKLLEQYGLARSPIILQSSVTQYNIGHTVPWSYEDPTEEEQKIIEGGNFNEIKNLISRKRIYLNPEEKFKIPPTIAFTTEIRIKSEQDITLPNTYFHMIVCFKNGQKKILGNFNPVFKALGMNFIKSKY